MNGIPPTAADVDHLGWSIERDGLAAHREAVAAVAARAADAGISPVLVGVLADPSEPEVARIRAFGLVAVMLARHLAADTTAGAPLPPNAPRDLVAA